MSFLVEITVDTDGGPDFLLMSPEESILKNKKDKLRGNMFVLQEKLLACPLM